MTNENLYTRTPGQIVMYLTKWCPDCRRAKSFFQKHNIPVLEVDIDGDARASDFVKEVNSGSRSVPTILFPDGAVLVEPSTEELTAKFSVGQA